MSALYEGDELALRRRGSPLNQALLWFMRLGIVAMLSITGAFLYTRYHQSDEQVELVRYVEVDLPALDAIESPIVQSMHDLLAARATKPEEARRVLVDELMPRLIRLRNLAEAPLRASRTPAVRALAGEYRATVDEFIDACRTAVRVIDDPKLDAATGLQQVQAAFHRAAEHSQAWRSHVAATSADLHLLKRRF
jgi:hypothetical protein